MEPEVSNATMYITDITDITATISLPPATNVTEWEFTDYKQRIFIACLFVIISMVGLVGNSLVIVSVLLSRKLQTPTNAFVVNTAAVDFLNCLFLPFNAVSMLSLDGWPLAPGVCAVSGGITMICLGGTLINLTLIAYNRAYLIKNPRAHYVNMYTPIKLGVMVLFAWGFPILAFALPPAIGVGKLGYSKAYKVCFWDDDHELSYVNDTIVAITFLVAFIIIVACYLTIYIFIKRHNRRLSVVYTPSKAKSPLSGESFRDSSSNSSTAHVSEKNHNSSLDTKRRRTKRREIQITKNLFYVVCAFFVCILPYPITLTIPVKSVADIYAGVLLMANSCVNPLIYSFKHPHFNLVFACMVRCRLDEIPQPTRLLKSFLLSVSSDKRRSSSVNRISRNETGETR